MSKQNRKVIFLCIMMMVFLTSSGLFAYQNYLTLSDEWSDYGIGDPFIMKFNGVYYLYCSTKDDQIGIKCWSSNDLVNWTYRGLCATATETRGAYAPEVVYWNGYFYMYTSPGGGGHYVLKSESPTGTFTVQTGNLGHSIDGSIFIDDNGNWYFYHADGNGIMGHSMSSPTSIGSDVLLSGTGMNGWTEGPCVIKRNGTYYITFCGNHVHSKGYRVNYAKNTTGPLAAFTASSQNPILLNTEGSLVGLGHSSTFIGPDLDTYYLTYHNYMGRNAQSWPIRHFCYDALGWNGDKLVVYGPSSWSMPNPALPVFQDRFDRAEIGSNWFNVNGGNWGIWNQQLLYQDSTGNPAFFMEISNNSTGADYTAEYNVKEAHRGSNDDISRLGAVFGFIDSNNYGIAVLSSYHNRLETNFLVNGLWVGAQYSFLPAGYDYQKWHNLRIEKSGNTYKFFVDGMLEQTRTNSSLGAGKIGYLSCDNHSDFGYIAFSNKVNGSGIFDFYKPVPGTIEAVHYNSGGEGVGYHDTTSGNTGGKYIRGDNVDIRDCPEGGHNIGWNATGEWYKYNVTVAETASYNLGLRYATTFDNCKVKIWFDSTDVTGAVVLPNTGGWDNWRTYTIKGLNLTSGNHTIRLETVQGEFDFYTLKFYKADNSSINIADNFDSGFSDRWNYADGNWAIEGGEASIDDTGKRLVGSTGWSDYTVEVDIKPISAVNGGIIFRVTNPALGGAGDDARAGSDFFQGYFAGLSSSGVVLGKHNYNWTQLASTSGSYSNNTWYHMKIVVSGNNFQVYVGDMNNPQIDYTDNVNPFINGKAGLRAHYAHTHFNNFNVYTTP